LRRHGGTPSLPKATCMKLDATQPAAPVTAAILRFFGHESAGGIVLALAAAAALGISNSDWNPLYQAAVHLPGELRVGNLLVLSKPLVVWVNDLWMAVFFLLVGLEIKREFVEGELADRRQALLPAVAALGGMVAPALIYSLCNAGDAQALRGWAIPAATDIAFAIAIVTLLGRRVPISLKVFLTAVAIIDDLGAIVIIALFFTAKLSLPMLLGAGLGVATLWLLNRAGVTRVDVYLAVGGLVWLCVLKSGVHATLAGVVTALAIPMRAPDGRSPAQDLEHGLHPWVAFLVLPVFAFVNAGIALSGVKLATLAEGVPLGIALGLLLGKTIGVFGSLSLMVRLGWAARPAASSWQQCLGVSVLCGIGFTMSLFIGGLAFDGLDGDFETRLKLGVLAGSLLSGAIGATILVLAHRRAD
jgi:Na+:H+ antiporter, NhaA family